MDRAKLIAHLKATDTTLTDEDAAKKADAIIALEAAPATPPATPPAPGGSPLTADDIVRLVRTAVDPLVQKIDAVEKYTKDELTRAAGAEMKAHKDRYIAHLDKMVKEGKMTKAEYDAAAKLDDPKVKARVESPAMLDQYIELTEARTANPALVKPADRPAPTTPPATPDGPKSLADLRAAAKSEYAAQTT